MAKIHVITVAAGSGTRFGSSLPKQFLPMAGLPVLVRTLEALHTALPQASQTVVIAPSEVERWLNLCSAHRFESPKIVHGGSSRFESVKNALSHIPQDSEIVLVHDGARPLPPADMIQRLISAFDDVQCPGAIPAINVTDSIRQLAPNGESEAVDRSLFRAVQTPQAFRAEVIKDAYLNADDGASFTDDASVVEAAGYSPLALVEGSHDNIKITNPRDIAFAEVILRSLQ